MSISAEDMCCLVRVVSCDIGVGAAFQVPFAFFGCNGRGSYWAQIRWNLKLIHGRELHFARYFFDPVLLMKFDRNSVTGRRRGIKQTLGFCDPNSLVFPIIRELLQSYICPAAGVLGT